jgi:hypothetical protein
MKRILVLASATFFVLTSCRTAQVETGPETGGVFTQTRASLPAGTTIVAELDNTLSAEDNEVGDRFSMTVKDDVMNGSTVVVPEGSKINGRITGLKDSSRNDDQAAIRVDFDNISIDGRAYALNAEVTDVDTDFLDRARTGDVSRRAGIGAAAGAVLGAVIGGSLKDILVGGVLGAGAGTIISLGMGDVENTLPRGTDLTLRTTQRIALR